MGGISAASLLAAVGGYLFTYYNSKLSKEREAQIDRINDQVRLLYGPLLACVSATRSAFDAMVHQHSNGNPPQDAAQQFVAAVRANPEGPEAQSYRRWMETVLQPLNERASQVIVEHADLLDSDAMEPLLLQLVAHVSAFKVILQKWKEGHVSEWSAIPYPDRLLDYATSEFRKVKARQAQLLGIAPGLRAKL